MTALVPRTLSASLPPEWYSTGRPEHDDEALGAYAAGDIDTLVRLAGQHALPVAVVSGLSAAENARIGKAVSDRRARVGFGRGA